MQLLHCTSTASSMQVQTPDSRTQRVFVSGALFGTVLAFFAGKTCDASLAAVPPSATIYFFYFLLTERDPFTYASILLLAAGSSSNTPSFASFTPVFAH